MQKPSAKDPTNYLRMKRKRAIARKKKICTRCFKAKGRIRRGRVMSHCEKCHAVVTEIHSTTRLVANTMAHTLIGERA